MKNVIIKESLSSKVIIFVQNSFSHNFDYEILPSSHNMKKSKINPLKDLLVVGV